MADSSFRRPTLEKLIRRGKSDVSSRLSGSDANLAGSPEETLVIAEAGMTHGAHGHIKWVSRQILTDLAEEEYVVREADVYGLERTPAEASEGTVTITGVNGSICPDGTGWVRGDGATFTQDGAATISAGEATITVIADDAGEDGDCAVGTKLTIASPVTGINASATVSGGGIVDGAEIEDIEALRERLLERKRNPPKAGGTGDYVAWAKQVAGVTRAWEVPRMLGPGTVGVYFVRDNDVSIIPDAGEILAVQTYIDSVRPITADVTVLAPTETPLPFVFTSLTPNTTDVQNAITAELEAVLSDAADPSTSVTIKISKIREAISIASGEEDYVLSSPSADVVVSAGTIRTLGSITWP